MNSYLGPLLHFLTAIHFVALGGLALYGMHRLWLLVQYHRLLRAGVAPSPSPIESARPIEEHPHVTVQLPVYNERFVAARLIDAVARIDWPAARLEIQVLDDSTDDTCGIVDARAAAWRQRGVAIAVVRRRGRDGYKAGALASGLKSASGEFVAVFDADFLPDPDFLRRSMGVFRDPRVGMAQGRWAFVNGDHSWMTRVQALFLNAHFRIEHQVRFVRGLFFNFNGTAGIWRRRAIEDAGGWQTDTITEDLDLSYRAQLRGWRFVYLDELVVPSELPVTLGAYRVQQRRWAKGSIQTARKILPRLLRSDLPWAVKLEATAHLLGNLGWLLGAVLIMTLYPAVLSRVGLGIHELLRLDLPLLIGSSGAILFYFAVSGQRDLGRVPWKAVGLIPLVSVGLAPCIGVAVMEGALASGGAFDRTPKFGLRGRERLASVVGGYATRTTPHLVINAALCIYACLPIAFAFDRGTWAAIPFLMLYPVGFGAYVMHDLRSRRPSGIHE